MPVVTFNDLRKPGAPLSSKEALKQYMKEKHYIPFKGTKSFEVVLKLAEDKQWADLLQELSKKSDGNRKVMAQKYIATRGVRKYLGDMLIKVFGKLTPIACKDELEKLEEDDNLIHIGMDLHGWNSNISDYDYPVLEALLDTVTHVEAAAEALGELKIVDDYKVSKK